MSAPRVLLLANYEPDGQQSMLRFARSLAGHTARRGARVSTWHPPRRWGPRTASYSGPGKWLGYLDKYLFALAALRRLAQRLPLDVVVHACDHSNAPLLRAFPRHRVAATCHDLLAVRGALGEPVHCPSTRTGALLQRWIVRALGSAELVVCDSHATRRDAERLLPRPLPRLEVVYPCLNDAIGSGPPPPRPEGALAPLGGRPYALHVGSLLPRKNRPAVVHAVAAARAAGWDGAAVFAGDPLDAAVLAAADRLGVRAFVHAVTRPAPELLRALYVHAHALVFPSHAEGFGYPVLEAQACGCPVIAADTTSLPEVAGPGAYLAAPDDTAAMARALVALADPGARRRAAGAGTANLARFGEDGFADAHIALWTALAGTASLPSA